MEETGGDMGSGNETDPVTPMVNDSHEYAMPFSTVCELCNYHHTPSG